MNKHIYLIVDTRKHLLSCDAKLISDVDSHWATYKPGLCSDCFTHTHTQYMHTYGSSSDVTIYRMENGIGR